MVMLHPREHDGQTELVFVRNHARLWKRNSLAVSAPTGQRSTTLPEYGLSSRVPGASPISSLLPRPKMPSSCDLETSSVNRTHRLHMMHRSASSTTCGPMSCTFGLWILSGANRDFIRP